MVDRKRPSIFILLNTTSFGNKSCPTWTCPGECSAKTLPPTGIFETETHIGDTFRIGSAEVLVTQPRMPCYKLGIRFGRADIIRRFLISERTGFYFSVLKEGEVGDG